MKDLEIIYENVQKDITEKTVMMKFKIDITNVAPFMCSPFCEGWIWSEKISDLNNYIFDLLIPEYLINVLYAYDSEQVEDKEYSFEESIGKYKESHYMENKDVAEKIDELIQLYNKYVGQDCSYLEFIKMIIKLERVLEILEIDFEGICYVNPYEARFSNSLKTDKFDYNNLAKNF